MKNKNAWFSPKLFCEAFRQLRLIGIICLILLSVAEALVLNGLYRAGNMNTYSVNALLLDLPHLAVMYLMVPVMMLVLFRFLNHRNGSDFYCSAPVTRECLFLSLIPAVVAWCAIVLTGGTAVSLLGLQLCCGKAGINFLSFWYFLFNCFAGCVFLIGAFSIAVSVTGTTFTNLIVVLLLSVLPRMLIEMMMGASLTIPHVIRTGQGFLPWLLDGSLNVVNWPINAILGGGRADPWLSLLNPNAGLYTLCVGIIFLAAGGILFHFRKSETAGKSAPNRVLQAIYRLSLALLVTLPCCELIYLNSGMSNTILVLYIIALIVYFLYELLTTKKLKNLLRAAPALLILVVLNVLLIGGKQLAYQTALAFQPDANEIRSVRILLKKDPSKTTDWFEAQTSQLALQDDTVNEIVSRTLKQQSKFWVDSGENHWGYFNRLNNYGSEAFLASQPVLIDCGGLKRERLIYMNRTDWEALTERLASNRAFQQIYCDLPSAESPGVSLSSETALSTESLRRIYQTLREEVPTLDFADWYAFLTQENGIGGIDWNSRIDNLTLRAAAGTIDTKTTFSLVPALLPKTCEQYWKECLPMQQKILQAARESNRDDDGYSLSGCSFWNLSDEPGTTYCDFSENRELFLSLIEQGMNAIPDPSEPFFSVTYMEYTSSTWVQYTAFFPIKDPEPIQNFLEQSGYNR